jgi:hypothetical protein
MTNLRGVWKENGREQDRYIKHITIRTMDPAHLAQFYNEVFELKEEEKAFEDPNYYLTDGKVTLVLTRPGFGACRFQSRERGEFQKGSGNSDRR